MRSVRSGDGGLSTLRYQDILHGVMRRDLGAAANQPTLGPMDGLTEFMQTNMSADRVSELLIAWRNGSHEARNSILELLHDDLYRIGSLLLSRDKANISLFTGDLVNEAVGRLLRGRQIDVTDRNHLLALSAKIMRQVLTDRARAKNREKRRGIRVTLTASNEEPPANSIELIALDVALTRLAAINPKHAEIVEMRFYGGLTIAEVASVQGVSPSTINRQWAALRLWLQQALESAIDSE